jgi:hypothetical protein
VFLFVLQIFIENLFVWRPLQRSSSAFPGNQEKRTFLGSSAVLALEVLKKKELFVTGVALVRNLIFS